MTAAAIGFGGELPRAQLPRTKDYSTTLLVGCGGLLGGGGWIRSNLRIDGSSSSSDATGPRRRRRGPGRVR
jgi:hypothetical protein